MKKFVILIFIVVLSSILGGLYGVIHDQITYTVSPEYYTRFKFIQFGLIDEGQETVLANPRLAVSIVGVMATWWMGLIIGLFLGLVGLMHKDHKMMFRATMKAMVVTLVVALATGLIGLGYGKLFLADSGIDWIIPENLIDRGSYIAVGSMHNFSYLGGLLGLVAGIVVSVRQRRKGRMIDVVGMSKM